jgi:conjugal transfer/type IV secretion protein DotA/TraY
LDFVNALFGTKGLISLDDPQNQVASPLALLSSMGKSLVEASIRNIVGGTLMMGVSMVKFAGIEAAGDAVSGLLFAIATATLTAGIVLYYVLPFMPFIYFFFAVGNWIKGIFEAMVGVPLWALAHIRIDGNGLPGEAAMNGYYMLFEIFLRPILILFGLLASVTIFSAMATVLNGIWPLATKNVTGANYDHQGVTGWLQAARGPVDQLFFTVMYAVILYIMALSSFKLIDLIPNQIMRWLGTGVSTFSDLAGDPAASLTQYTSIVGQQMSSKAIGGIRSVGSGLKSAAEGIQNMGSGK